MAGVRTSLPEGAPPAEIPLPDDRVPASFTFAVSVLTEAILSFLGAGAPPSVPSWGTMVAEGRNYIEAAPWLMFFPGCCIAIVVMGLNLLGDGLRDLLDPRLRGGFRGSGVS